MERLDKMFSKDLLDTVRNVIEQSSVETIKEESVHSVHVSTYDSKGNKQLNSKEFKQHVKEHGGEVHYVSDKGVAFKFKKPTQAENFHRAIAQKFKYLGSTNDGPMSEEVELDERNKENKFKKDLFVAQKGKKELNKGMNFAKYDKNRIADTKGNDYGMEYGDDDDASERHASRKTALRTYKYAGRKALAKEEAELDEGVRLSKPQKPFSEIKNMFHNTAGELKKIATGKDFEVHTGYSGSLKRQAHYVVNPDKDEVIGIGWTMPSALKNAGRKPSDVKHYSKFAPGSILNTMKENANLDEGRGRPPKEGSEAWKRRQAAAEAGDEGETDHIIASLRKASHNMTGKGAVKFNGGIEMVDREHARRAVANYMDKRTPNEKDEYTDKISHSYGHLKKNI